MNIKELEALTLEEKDRSELIQINHLENQNDRTLLYGFDCDRNTWHTYIKDGEIHKVVYGYEESPKKREVYSNYEYVPNKRLYPECCDFEFCKLLKLKDVILPFTSFQERYVKQYYGKVL